jgi:hypothetical protein
VLQLHGKATRLQLVLEHTKRLVDLSLPRDGKSSAGASNAVRASAIALVLDRLFDLVRVTKKTLKLLVLLPVGSLQDELGR